MVIHFFYNVTQFFLIVASLYAAIYGYIYKGRFKEMRLLYIYPAASFAESFVSPTIIECFPNLEKAGFADMMINLFLLLEIFIIFHFYVQILKKRKTKIILVAVAICYCLSMILFWLAKNSFNRNSETFFVPQAIVILTPCFYYFFELARNPLTIELKSEPTFWVMLGIMLYFGCTLPLFLLDSMLDFSNALERKIYGINCLCYGLFYLLLIKAYLCKMRKAQ